MTKTIEQKLKNAAIARKGLLMLCGLYGSKEAVARVTGLSEGTVSNYTTWPLDKLNPEKQTIDAILDAVTRAVGVPRHETAAPAPVKVQTKAPTEAPAPAPRRPEPFWFQQVPSPVVGAVFGIVLALVLSWASK